MYSSRFICLKVTSRVLNLFRLTSTIHDLKYISFQSYHPFFYRPKALFIVFLDGNLFNECLLLRIDEIKIDARASIAWDDKNQFYDNNYHRIGDFSAINILFNR